MIMEAQPPVISIIKSSIKGKTMSIGNGGLFSPLVTNLRLKNSDTEDLAKESKLEPRGIENFKMAEI